MKTVLNAILRDSRGATAVEYGLIITLIVLAMAGALSGFANKVNNQWNFVSNEVSRH